MMHFKKLILYFLFLYLIPGIQGYLYPGNGWPTSFTYHYGNAENPILNMFKDEKVSKWFNRGYNPDDRYSPIKKKWYDAILENLKENSHKVAIDAVNQVKNCSDFNKLFEKNASKNLSGMKNRVTFTPNIPGDGYGTVGNYDIFVKDLYLKYFLYHMGKQAREIENGQRTDFDLTTDSFNIGSWGDIDKNPITKNIAHELMHVLSGWNGGRQMAECIVHCLSKKCSDPDHDFREVNVTTFGQHTAPIDCHKIQEKFWKGKEDIADEMDAGDCFYGIEKAEKSVDKFQDSWYTILSCTGYKMAQKRSVNQDVSQVQT